MHQRSVMTSEEIFKRYVLPAAVEILKVDPQIGYQRAVQQPLYGQDSVHSSIELVSFVVELEQRLSEDLNFTIRLLSEKALSQKSSPFSNLKTITDFCRQVVSEAES